jgi:hypothetical protein
MDMAEAQRLTAVSLPTLSEHRQMLADKYADRPQLAGLAALSMASVEEGLAKLASMGHRFKLILDPDQPVESFPMMLYADGSNGAYHVLAHDEKERDELVGQGFRTTPRAEPEPRPIEERKEEEGPRPDYIPPPSSAPAPGLAPLPSFPDELSNDPPPMHQDADLPVPGAAGAGATTGPENLVGQTDDAQREQIALAEEAVAPKS